MTDYSSKYIKEFLELVLENVQDELDQESINAVNHYIDHDEYELAFEGLFIEIMKVKKVLDVEINEIKKIGKVLRLDKDSVFDADFWEKFKEYKNLISPIQK